MSANSQTSKGAGDAGNAPRTRLAKVGLDPSLMAFNVLVVLTNFWFFLVASNYA